MMLDALLAIAVIDSAVSVPARKYVVAKSTPWNENTRVLTPADRTYAVAFVNLTMPLIVGMFESMQYVGAWGIYTFNVVSVVSAVCDLVDGCGVRIPGRFRPAPVPCCLYGNSTLGRRCIFSYTFHPQPVQVVLPAGRLFAESPDDVAAAGASQACPVDKD